LGIKGSGVGSREKGLRKGVWGGEGKRNYPRWKKRENQAESRRKVKARTGAEREWGAVLRRIRGIGKGGLWGGGHRRTGGGGERGKSSGEKRQGEAKQQDERKKT